MKCMLCGKGNVIETEEKNHETEVAGIKLVLPVALVGRCDTCKQINYAFRKDGLNGGTHAEDCRNVCFCC